MNLWEFSGKKIKIIDIDGRKFVGLGDLYTSEIDNPDGVETLSLWTSGVMEEGSLIEFELDEIASIEVIPSGVSIPLAVGALK